MKTNMMPMVRLRATINIDVDAVDYLEAGQHQKKLEALLGTLRADYPDASFTVSERRPPSQGPARRRDFRVSTGKLNSYE